MSDPRMILALVGLLLAAVAFAAFLAIEPIMQWRMGWV
jgi:hypothetical protein